MLSYEDFTIGRVFKLGPKRVTKEEILEFAEEFDPQPFHLDEHSEQARQVGGLIASGWHNCSMAMRMMCDGYLLDTHSQGSGGLDEIKWIKPVRPGDEITGHVTVTDRRISKSKPELGMIQFSYIFENQNDEVVFSMKGMGFVRVIQNNEGSL